MKFINLFFVLILGIFVLGTFVVGVSNETRTMVVEHNPHYSNNFKIQSFSKSPEVGIFDLTDEEISRLKRDDSLIVREPYVFHTFLDEAVIQQNVSGTWNLQVDNMNLTGVDVAVCVIDSGIDSSHPDLVNKILDEHCFCSSSNCCPDGTGEDDNATDDNGHGTHVAGIVAASGGINGVGMGANLVIVKATDYTGSGYEPDLINAVEWCVNNSDSYNITAISMSLGADCDLNPSLCYSSVCSGESAVLQSKIGAAVAKNISVVIATGNEANKTHISWPACLPDVTRVASIDKDDSTISTFSNINSLVKLLGVGENVNSTMPIYEVSLTNSTYMFPYPPYDNYYDQLSGTSMATPMVSGAIAVLSQYLRKSGQSLNTGEIEDLLYDNGKKILYGGVNYSRFNLYGSLLDIDVTEPVVNLVSPVNNHINLTVNRTFVCNASDWQLANVTLRVWNASGAVYYNESQNLTGVSNGTNFSLTNMSYGDYEWNCFVEDLNGNLGFASENFSLTVGGVRVDLSPANDTYTNVNYSGFNCSAWSEENYALSNISFYLWNSSGVLINSSVVNVSGFENTTSFNYTFVDDGNYSWECVAYNNNSDLGDGVNYTLTLDTVLPEISGLSSGDPGTSSATISWVTVEDTNSSLSISSGSWSNSSEYVGSHSIGVSGLSAGTVYSYVVYSCDMAGNCASAGGSFTTDSRTSSGGGGGSSSSRSVVVNEIKSDDVVSGVIESLDVGSEIIFSVKGDLHKLGVKEVGLNWVHVTVSSDILDVILFLNVPERIDFDSDGVLDLELLLLSVGDDGVNIFVRELSEDMFVENVSETVPGNVSEGIDVVEKHESFFVRFWRSVIYFLRKFF